jgi:hypothetical protein
MSVNGTHLINGWLVWETHYNGSEASDHCVLVDQIETFNGPSQYGHTEIRTKSGQVLRAPGEARALLLTYLKLRGKLRSDAQMARKIV